MPDKYSTFELNKLILDQLKDYAVEYRTNKLQNNLEFLESESQKAEEQYNLSEEALAEYADRNLVISTQKSQIALESLRNKEKFRLSNLQWTRTTKGRASDYNK